MGISHKVLPTVESRLGMETNAGRHSTQDDQADQATHLPGTQVFLEKDDQNVDRRFNNTSKEDQILALYDEYRPRLFRYMRSMHLHRDQAEEVIQETFMRLTTHLLRDDSIENVQGWIVRVAHNFAVDVLKKNGRDVSASEGAFSLENRVDPTSSPEEAYLKKEQIRRMESALSKLNAQQRQCFHMRAQGFRYRDIALAVEISEQRAAFVVKQVAVRLAAICG